MASSNVQYPWPSNLNPAYFVPTKLFFLQTSTNYHVWKEEMLCLVEGQDMLGFIDGTILPPQPETSKEYLLWRRSDKLLKGWILGSLTATMQVFEVALKGTSRDVWLYLENHFSQFSHAPQPQPQIQNVDDSDSSDTEDDRQDKDMIEYMPLNKAALAGEWETAKGIFDGYPGAKAMVLNSLGMTALQVAVGTGKRSIQFVQKMVEMADEELITAQNCYGDTALHIAASVGNTEAAAILASVKPSLLYIANSMGEFPVQRAALFGKKKMLEYLLSVTKEKAPYEGMAGLKLLMYLIYAEFFDVALTLVDKYPILAKLTLPSGESALSVLASEKSYFSNGGRGRGRSLEHFSLWERFSLYAIFSRTGVTSTTMENQKKNEQALGLARCLCKNMESMSYSEATNIANNALITATRLGIHDVVEMIVEAFPNAIYACVPGSNGYIFHVAVRNRSEDVFNLIYQMSDHKYTFSDLVDIDGNNLLHSAAIMGPPHKLNEISGAALQMQREIQWYKEVEKVVSPSSRTTLNKAGRTPKMIFVEEHEDLKKDGEEWMKDTSGSCSIAAALIVTIMFAAAITVPGGNESSTGLPVFSRDVMFLVFAISDAISLFASTTSLLMFLSILTSRYAEEDFQHVLPKRLVFGLGSLFFSITFMMVAFSATLYLVFGQNKAWVLIPVAVLACLPITSFVLLQFPLLADLYYSTYRPGIFGKQSDRPFY